MNDNLTPENSTAQARDFLRTMLSQVAKKKEVHDAKKAAKDEEYDRFVANWQGEANAIAEEMRRFSDAMVILEPHLPPVRARKDYGVKEPRGRKPVVCHEFQSALVQWHAQIKRIYTRDEFYDFFLSFSKKFDKEGIGKRLHMYVRLANLISIRFDNHRTAYFGLKSWLNIKSEYDIEIKPDFDFPLYSAPHGVRLPMKVSGLKNKKKKE